MTSETHASETDLEFIALSRPRMWVMIVLPLAAALLIYVGWESLGTDFSLRGRGAFLNDLPPWLRGAFLFGVAAVCLGAWLQQLRRKLSPQVEVKADPQGITSHLFWGKGRLRWPDIVALERRVTGCSCAGPDPMPSPRSR